MNLYSSKQRWKIILFVLALGIVAASLWYSSVIVDQVREEEREKVIVWSTAIKKKANSVYLTNQLFKSAHREDSLKAQVWSSAVSFMSSSGAADVDFGLPAMIFTNNTTIPIIQTDESGDMISKTNLPVYEDSVLDAMELDYHQEQNDSIKAIKKNAFELELSRVITELEDGRVPLKVESGFGSTFTFHYGESILIKKLKFKHDSLISSFTNELVNNSLSVPVIFVNNERDSVIASSKKDISAGPVDEKTTALLEKMAISKDPFEVVLGNNEKGYVYYEDSAVLTQLKYYPYIQFGIIGLFLLVSYFLFSTFRRQEQNQVWVGLAKETAHQLGTPLSSLMAWVELLEAKGVDAETINELNKDVQRLETITDRFSKIGSETELKPQLVSIAVEDVADYLRKRVSRKMTIEVVKESDPKAPLNRPLFEWVIENLSKNAIDAMKGNGSITITISSTANHVHIDLTDTGSGIPASKFKTVFQPGYTTKKRGWGLGLSLVKRIVEQYHNGQIFVKSSELGKGTTFRIVLKKEK